MINFLYRQSRSLSTTFLCICAIVLLQGCGAERTTPFDPQLPVVLCSSSSSSSSSSSLDNLGFISSSSSSSSSASSCTSSTSTSSSSISSSSSSNSSSSYSSASSVEKSLIWSGTQTSTVIDKKEKNIQVLRNSNDFYATSNAYVNFNLDNQNFDEGQVILVDDGEVNSCAAHLEFNTTISAVELTDNTVKVTVNYVEKPALDKCSPTFSRPFYFYYVRTKKLLVFEEKIN